MYSLLMLFPFALVLGTAILFIFLAAHWSRKRSRKLSQLAGEHFLTAPAKTGFSPSIFEQPSRWLAIRSNDSRLIQAALGLHSTTPCSWEDGLQEAREHKMFVSPSIEGWVVVVGSAMPDPADDVDACFHFLRELSRKVGQVQFFSANRVLYHHAWALADQGNIFRAYAWAGETLWNQGPVTAAERELRIQLFAYGTERSAFLNRDPLLSNSEKVFRLAARWSVDPLALREVSANDQPGIVGSFSQSKLH